MNSLRLHAGYAGRSSEPSAPESGRSPADRHVKIVPITPKSGFVDGKLYRAAVRTVAGGEEHVHFFAEDEAT